MKRTARFVLAALALSAAPARGQDPQPPAFRLPATAAPVSCDVDLTIDPGQTRLLGKAGIEVRLGEATRVLWLNAREIEIDAAAATFAGTPVGVRAIAGGTEFVGLAFEREIGPGALALRLTYRAAIRENSSQGVFRQKDGDQFYVYTQFETTDARRAIPCFDEPAYKVPWQLTLRIPKGMTAVSNTPVESDAAGADGGRVVRFRKTPPLPSYLIAFGIGPFEYVDAGRAGKKRIPVRIVVPRGKADRTKLAVETTGPLLEKLEDYFSIPFPYDKLDQLVIPQTVTFSAMENPGLITWGEQYLLESPGRASGSMRRFAIFVNAHEIAHQWFGDLVTPTWWDDIWLNESFADWAAHKAVAAWRPDSGSEITELDDLFDALGADSVLAARQLHQPIVTADDIENAFDPISYEKGSAVLTMFESWIGEAKFRKGVRRYLQAHAHKTATSRDFLAAIEAEGIPGAAAAMATFLDQPGVPLIDAALSCDVSGRPRLTLSQTRYLPIGSPRPAPQIWHVPVCARDSGGKASDSVCTLLKEERGVLELPRGTCPDWAVLRAGGAGYYRVRYEESLAARIAAVEGSLPVVDRGFLVRDTAGLAQGGAVPVAQGLDLSRRAADDPNWFLVDASVRLPTAIAQDDVAPASREDFARWVRQSWGDRARALGFEGRTGEGDNERRLRRGVLPFVAGVGEDPELLAEARRLAQMWLEDRSAADPDMVPPLLELAARQGDRALYERFLAEAKRASERRDRLRVLRALGTFPDPGLRRDAFELSLGDAFPPLEGMQILYGAVFADLLEVREDAWEFVKSHYDAIVARVPPETLGNLPAYANGFCDPTRRAEIEAFFAPRVASLPGGPRNLSKTLERIDQCVAFRKAAEPEVRAFLSSSGNRPASGPP
jgi:alanyl aminopeptidase